MEGGTARGHARKPPTARPLTAQVQWIVEVVLYLMCVFRDKGKQIQVRIRVSSQSIKSNRKLNYKGIFCIPHLYP